VDDLVRIAEPVVYNGPDRLSFDQTQGKVIYQYGKTDAEREEMDYLESMARGTSIIPSHPDPFKLKFLSFRVVLAEQKTPDI
jgi:hypothetical protein